MTENMSQVSEPEFVRVCTLDGELGTLVIKIYRSYHPDIFYQ